MVLAVISHTRHFKDMNGNVVGWGPTVREMNYLATKFETVYHCAPLHEEEIPPSSLGYAESNIVFVPLIPSGGNSLVHKLGVLRYAIENIRRIKRTIERVDVFQFRAPTGMGIYAIPFLNLMVSKKGWFKYAGNWAQKRPPFGYAIQRFYLKHQTKRKVTINGKWPGQPDHCITFENPCLFDEELQKGVQSIEEKRYDGKLDFCFVGRLETAKGVRRILEAFTSLGAHPRVNKIHLIGDGVEKKEFEKMAKTVESEVIFHGYLGRDKIGDILQSCHVFLLPSTASEGFPKAIAEAANYGCVPVVSDVSSIGQYIHQYENGFLVDHRVTSCDALLERLLEVLESKELKTMASSAAKIVDKFTFRHYYTRIISEVIDS
ncbi:MAG: glycosyltransferase family 4 protein [Marinilabiliaceae bacterium]|nr:glycosyltransferase family 4 protein [Marinilabiliaceae bacterium]